MAFLYRTAHERAPDGWSTRYSPFTRPSGTSRRVGGIARVSMVRTVSALAMFSTRKISGSRRGFVGVTKLGCLGLLPLVRDSSGQTGPRKRAKAPKLALTVTVCPGASGLPRGFLNRRSGVRFPPGPPLRPATAFSGSVHMAQACGHSDEIFRRSVRRGDV